MSKPLKAEKEIYFVTKHFTCINLKNNAKSNAEMKVTGADIIKYRNAFAEVSQFLRYKSRKQERIISS